MIPNLKSMISFSFLMILLASFFNCSKASLKIKNNTQNPIQYSIDGAAFVNLNPSRLEGNGSTEIQFDLADFVFIKGETNLTITTRGATVRTLTQKVSFNGPSSQTIDIDPSLGIISITWPYEKVYAFTNLTYQFLDKQSAPVSLGALPIGGSVSVSGLTPGNYEIVGISSDLSKVSAKTGYVIADKVLVFTCTSSRIAYTNY